MISKVDVKRAINTKILNNIFNTLKTAGHLILKLLMLKFLSIGIFLLYNLLCNKSK